MMDKTKRMSYGHVGIPVYTTKKKVNSRHVALWFVGAAAAAAVFCVVWVVTP